MVKIQTNGYDMYLDGTLKANLDHFKYAVTQNNMDYLFICGGAVGTGKSVFTGGTIGAYLDPTFRGQSAINRMCQTPQEFKDEVMKAKKFQFVNYDEAVTGTTGKRSMAKMNFTIFSMLEQIRQKNLYIGITLPNWFTLDANIALDRATTLYYVYTPKDQPFSRGRFAFFNRSKKHILWYKGKRFHTMAAKLTTSANFIGRFTHQIPFDESEYQKKKLESFEAYVRSMEGTVKVPIAETHRFEIHRNSLVKVLYDSGKTQLEIAELVGKFGGQALSKSNISLILKRTGVEG